VSDPKHVIGLSGGKDSTALALRLVELHPEIDFEFIGNWTGNELPEMIAQASRVVVVCQGGFTNWAMQKRNEWMADNCDRLFALWDGSAGGTANCVAYAKRVGRETLNLWPVWHGPRTL
jgi:hypothetical protein